MPGLLDRWTNEKDFKKSRPRKDEKQNHRSTPGRLGKISVFPLTLLIMNVHWHLKYQIKTAPFIAGLTYPIYVE